MAYAYTATAQTGTVAVTSGSNAVTGTGTNFGAGNLVAGRGVLINGEYKMIQATSSTTAMTMTSNFAATVSGAAFYLDPVITISGTNVDLTGITATTSTTPAMPTGTVTAYGSSTQGPGTVSTTAASTTVTGVNTAFGGPYQGHWITIGTETRKITSVASTTSLTVGVAFANTNSGVFWTWGAKRIYDINCARINITGSQTITPQHELLSMRGLMANTSLNAVVEVNVASGGSLLITGSESIASVTNYNTDTAIVSDRAYSNATNANTAFINVASGGTYNAKGGVVIGNNCVIFASGSTCVFESHIIAAEDTGPNVQCQLNTTGLTFNGPLVMKKVRATIGSGMSNTTLSNFQPTMSGRGLDWGNGNTNVTLVDFAPNGNTNDGVLRAVATWKVIGTPKGSNINIIYYAVGVDSNNGGAVTVYSKVAPSVTNAAGSAISAVMYMKDTNNGARFDQTSSFGSEYNLSADRTYMWTVSGGTAASQNVLLMGSWLGNGAAGSTIVYDVRNTGGVRGTDTFNFDVWAYSYQTLRTAPNVAGTGTITVGAALLSDTNVTLTETAAGALTSLSTLDDLYDSAKYWKTRTTQSQIEYPTSTTQPVTASGTVLDLGSRNLVVDASAASAFAINTGTNTITVKASTLAQGTKFKSITTTGTVAVANGALIQSLVTSASGAVGNLILTGVTGASILVSDNSGVAADTQIGYGSASYTYWTGIGPSGTWTYKVAKYGSAATTGSFDPTATNTVSVSLSSDSGITQATAATVAAYTTLGTPDKIYDYAAYWETTSSGIAISRVATKSGTSIDFGSRNVTIDASAGSLWAAPTGSVTVKASALGAGATFANVTTTGSFTLANAATVSYPVLVTSSAGATGWFSVTGLSSHSLAVYDNSASRQVFASAQSGQYNYSIAAGATGSWSYRVTKHGFTPQTGTFTPSGGGLFSAAQSTVTDVAVTQTTAATVAAYTSLDTPEMLYDYSSYWTTTTTGIDVTKFTAKAATAMDLGSVVLVQNTGAGSVWSYNTGTTTLTVKSAASFTQGATFASVTTTGAVTLTGVTYAYPLLLTSSAGTTGWFTITGLSSHSVAVYTNSGTRNDYATGVSGSRNLALAAGVTGTWSYTITKHGFTAATGTFTPAGGGLFSVAQATTSDAAVTQTTAATVAAYTSLDNPDKLYDYSSYWATTSTGIDVVKFTSKAAASVSLGSVNLVANAAAGSVWSYNTGTTTLTVKSAASHAAGSTFTSYTTTGSVTLTGVTAAYPLLITSTAGTTGWLSLTSLSGESVAVYDNTATRADYQTAVTGDYRLSLAAGSTGTWNWITKSGNELLATSSVTVTGGGLFSATPLRLSDTTFTAGSVATVAAYTTLDTLDRLYDYIAYYKTTSTGIAQPTLSTQLASKNGTTLDLGSHNLIVSGSAGSVFAYNAGTGAITIKSSLLAVGTTFTSLTTTGTLSTTGGGSVDDDVIVTDSTGTTGHLHVTGVLAGSSIAVFDNADTQQTYAASSGTSYHYKVAASATGTWHLVIKKAGYDAILLDFPADGTTLDAVAQVQILTAQGGAAYTTDVDSLATIAIAGSSAFLDVGDGLLGLQAAYNATENALTTSAGLTWLHSGKAGTSLFSGSAGDFLFLSTGWRIRRHASGDNNATLNAFAVSADGTVVDGTNGPVAFLSSSETTQLATWLTQQPIDGPLAINSIAWYLAQNLKVTINRMITDPVTGTMRLYDDDDTTLMYSGNLYEDAAGTTPFTPTSSKINRRDRLT